MAIEKRTDELRVVLSDSTGPGRPVMMVQRKFLVQNGKMYCPADFGPPDNKEDVFVNVIEGRPMWQPMKVIWRNLPTVGEEEAMEDTQNE
jgi:hypothetical protein